ncbi:MAG: hypothetical protein IIA50_01640 [Bacteroidetes bacterium]|nr:hypothetical protein [Bacteroidota bacterium]
MKTTFRVGILGATGAVGQKFVELLAGHPWFEVAAVIASARSAGKTYREAVNWTGHAQMPDPRNEDGRSCPQYGSWGGRRSYLKCGIIDKTGLHQDPEGGDVESTF